MNAFTTPSGEEKEVLSPPGSLHWLLHSHNPWSNCYPYFMVIISLLNLVVYLGLHLFTLQFCLFSSFTWNHLPCILLCLTYFMQTLQTCYVYMQFLHFYHCTFTIVHSCNVLLHYTNLQKYTYPFTVDEHTGCFEFWAPVNNAALNFLYISPSAQNHT